MQIKPEQLAAHVRRAGLAPVYLLAGDEPLLRDEAAANVRAAARAAGYDERQVLHAEAGFDWSELAAVGAALSLFASNRLIEVHLTAKGPGQDGAAALKAYAGDPPPATILVVHAGRLDGPQRKSAWFRALTEAGVTVYAWRMAEAAFGPWLQARARSRGLVLDEQALETLAARTEGNLLAAAQEIERLALLFPQGAVTSEDLRAATADSARFELFDLSAKALAGDPRGVVRSLARLREEGIDPVPILWALVRDLRLLFQVALAGRAGNAGRVLDDPALRLPLERKRQIAALGRRRSPPELLALLRRAARADRICKGAASGLAWEELITLALGLAGAQAPAGMRDQGNGSR